MTAPVDTARLRLLASGAATVDDDDRAIVLGLAAVCDSHTMLALLDVVEAARAVGEARRRFTSQTCRPGETMRSKVLALSTTQDALVAALARLDAGS